MALGVGFLSRAWFVSCPCGQEYRHRGTSKMYDVAAALVAEGWSRYAYRGKTFSRGPWTCPQCAEKEAAND